MLCVVQTKAQTKTIKRRVTMTFKKINTKQTKKNLSAMARKLYASWFVGVTIVSAVLIYGSAASEAQMFLAASLFIFGLVKLTDSLK